MNLLLPVFFAVRRGVYIGDDRRTVMARMAMLYRGSIGV
jgi:hypothetical protein